MTTELVKKTDDREDDRGDDRAVAGEGGGQTEQKGRLRKMIVMMNEKMEIDGEGKAEVIENSN